MVSFLTRIKTWWNTADRNQRVVTLGGIGALLLLLVGSVFFVTRPHYVTLMDGLSEADKSAVVSTLETAGFKPGIDRQGAVEIAEGDKAKAQLALAKAGTMPKGSHHWGQNDLTKAGPFTSPEVERETLNSILEGEISTILESMEGVASANVLITSPKQSVFAEDKVRPTASVMITEDGRGMLSRENGRTIANLVCGAVDGMRPEDVVVVSSAIGELWNGNSPLDDTKASVDDKVAHGWETRLQAALDPVFGVGNTRVIVRADVDTDRVRTEERQVNPAAKPTSVITEKESMDGGRKAPGGAAGAVANTDDAAKALAAQASGDKGQKYDKTGVKKDFENNEVKKVTENGVGALKGLSITVVANSEKVTDETAVKKIVDGVMGGKIELDASGVPLPNQSFTTTVTSVKFDGTAGQAAKEAADRLASQQRTQQILSLLPIAAILMVALLVAKQVGRISRAVLPAEVDPIAAFAEEVPDALPGAEGPDALPVRSLEGDEQADGSDTRLEQFKAQIDVPLESLKQMAAERPELVATLIKSMMLGEGA